MRLVGAQLQGMAFAPGDRVHLAGLGTGVVRQVRGGGRYAIEIKGRMVVAPESQLELASGDAPRRQAESPRPAPRAAVHTPAAASLDLHGKTVAESLDALDAFVNDALLSGHHEVRIIHGRSGGSVKTAAHRYLKRIAAVEHFRLDPHNPGVTIVTFA